MTNEEDFILAPICHIAFLISAFQRNIKPLFACIKTLTDLIGPTIVTLVIETIVCTIFSDCRYFDLVLTLAPPSNLFFYCRSIEVMTFHFLLRTMWAP